ncbi:hypothetical protein [Staphylococcus xylosus]|nr:hypothetical protein [Staphylococcus xylosus]
MYESNPESKVSLDILRKYGVSEDNSILVLLEMGALGSTNGNEG